jgi:hypothetical protein
LNYQKNDISLIEKGHATPKENRIYYLDNLRPFMIFLVVLYHTVGVYESSGIWSSFWRIEDPSTNDLASFNKCIYLLGNKNIFEPKKLRLLQLIGISLKLLFFVTLLLYMQHCKIAIASTYLNFGIICVII